MALALVGGACAPGAPDGSGVAGPGGTAPAVTVAWDRPTVDADGDSLGDLAGFRLYVAQDSPVRRDAAQVQEVGDTTRHTLTGLEAGVHYLAVAAVDTAGNESELSDGLRAEVESP